MVEEPRIKNIRDKINGLRKKYWEVNGRIKELEEREERLNQELERIRDHLDYYESLVSDMKKEMQTKKDTDFLKEL